MKSRLSSAELDNFSDVLQKERDRLKQSEIGVIFSAGSDSLEINTQPANNNDEGVDQETVNTDISLEDHILESIANLDRALERIKFGQYGQCIECNTAIPILRLNAFPAAVRCVQCKTNFEAQYSKQHLNLT